MSIYGHCPEHKNDTGEECPTCAINALRSRVKELERLLELADRAIGDHNAPSDCYATGPMTGDPIQDLVVCPACAYLNARKG